MATLYKANGERIAIKPRRRKFTIKELQDAVGGYITYISFNGNYLVVDEDGLPKELPYNRNASRIARQFGYGPIVGDAVFCTESEMLQ